MATVKYKSSKCLEKKEIAFHRDNKKKMAISGLEIMLDLFSQN